MLHSGTKSLDFFHFPRTENRTSQSWGLTFPTMPRAEGGPMARSVQGDWSLNKGRAQPGRKNQKEGGHHR